MTRKGKRSIGAADEVNRKRFWKFVGHLVTDSDDITAHRDIFLDGEPGKTE